MNHDKKVIEVLIKEKEKVNDSKFPFWTRKCMYEIAQKYAEYFYHDTLRERVLNAEESPLGKAIAGTDPFIDAELSIIHTLASKDPTINVVDYGTKGSHSSVYLDRLEELFCKVWGKPKAHFRNIPKAQVKVINGNDLSLVISLFGKFGIATEKIPRNMIGVISFNTLEAWKEDRYYPEKIPTFYLAEETKYGFPEFVEFLVNLKKGE